MIDLLNLPKGKIMIFNGDPQQYGVFMNSFDSTVHNTFVDDGIKLHRLLEYCTGKTAKVIQCCALMNPADGYLKARMLLSE